MIAPWVGRAGALLVAEAGVNHDGFVERAHRLVDAAADAGVDAVKFQTFRADEVISPSARKAPYQLASGPGTQLEMVRALELPPEAFLALRDHAVSRGLLFLSTPFDEASVDLLVLLGVPALKIASGEIDNVPLLRRVAATGLPVMISTGMATQAEVDAAVAELARAAALAILQCTSAYPAPLEESSLRAMLAMSERAGATPGFSDHTRGHVAAVAAAVLGARVLEKHLTLDPGAIGPDHSMSASPPELAQWVEAIRGAESALGDGTKRVSTAEARNLPVVRRAIVARRKIRTGEPLTEVNITTRRPAQGIPAARWDLVVGRTAHRDYVADEPIEFPPETAHDII